jgi:serine/threonine protein kinase
VNYSSYAVPGTASEPTLRHEKKLMPNHPTAPPCRDEGRADSDLSGPTLILPSEPTATSASGPDGTFVVGYDPAASSPVTTDGTFRLPDTTVPPALPPVSIQDQTLAPPVGPSPALPPRPAEPNVTDVRAPARDTKVVRKLGADIPRFPPVAGYQLLEELGHGGMGVVYKARHLKLNRLVALKMILAGGRASRAERERFTAEAEAVAQLLHPNIVQIYEIGEQNGLPFFALEFVEGGTLEDHAGRTPQPPLQAARIVAMLAEGMDCAHQRGIIHRDLKPANVLLAPASGGGPGGGRPPAEPGANWVPKITDFGLAKRLEGSSGRTSDGSILGTPSYMAPEQAEGRVRELGPASDVYSLGAILYDLLAGRPPFHGETVMDTLQQVIKSDPVPPVQLQPGVPRDLQIIALKCLEKEPRKRYPDAGALARDLRRFLDGRPIEARPTPAWERACKWARRRPTTAALLAVSILALLALAVGGFVFARVEGRRADEAHQLREYAEDQHRQALASAARAREQEALARTALGHYGTVLLDLLVSQGDHEAATKALEELQREAPNALSERKAAAILVSCVVLARKDARLSEAQRKTAADAYGARAVGLLRRAATKDAEGIGGALFDPLRGREDFRKLLRDLDGK